MTIDPAPETDARPASDGDGIPADDTDVTAVVDRTDDETTEQSVPAPFDAEAVDAEAVDADAGDAAPTLPPPPAPPDTDGDAAPIVTEPPSAPPTAPPPAPSAAVAPAVAPVVVPAVTATEPEPASAPRERRRRGRRIKARQVQRVITRVDPWSMLKVSLLFALSMWLIVVVAGVLIWRVAVSTGTISNFENFLAQTLGEDTFTIDGSQIFQGSIVVGLVFFVTGAVFAVVTSVLFNLIAGLVGGVRFTMVELETVRPVEEPAATP